MCKLALFVAVNIGMSFHINITSGHQTLSISFMKQSYFPYVTNIQ